MPTLSQLITRHPEHKERSHYWALLKALSNGGEQVDERVKRELLADPDGRPEDVIAERIKVAPYFSSIAPILLRLQSQLLAKEAVYTGSNDEFWQQFKTDRAFIPSDDNPKTSFHGLLKVATLNALIERKAIAQIDTQADSDEPYVVLRDRGDLWDWASDQDGLVYAKLHTCREYRPRWDALMVREHDFYIYQREDDGAVTASRYVLRLRSDLDPSQKTPMPFDERALENLKDDDVIIEERLAPTEIFHVVQGQQRIFRFPVVIMTLPSTLWLADQLFDCQKSAFNQQASLEWALLSTNYAQFIIEGSTNADETRSRLSTQGNGYFTVLEGDERASWLEREGKGMDFTLKYRDVLKSEMMEIISQIAWSAANSTSVIARSGESKKEDRRNLEILLEVYGESVRSFAKQILDVASIARNEAIEWTVDGFSHYEADGLADDLQEYLTIDQVNIDSPTLKAEGPKQLASVIVQELGIPEKMLPTILQEIDNSQLKKSTPSLEEIKAIVELLNAQSITKEEARRRLKLVGWLIDSDPDEMPEEETSIAPVTPNGVTQQLSID